jgi:hypothetical protein
MLTSHRSRDRYQSDIRLRESAHPDMQVPTATNLMVCSTLQYPLLKRFQMRGGMRAPKKKEAAEMYALS